MNLSKWLLPKLYIHSWGGIGSQLCAVSVYFDLLHSNKRRIRLVLHSSGVTRRDDATLRELFPSLEYSFLDDYREVEASGSIQGTQTRHRSSRERCNSITYLKRFLHVIGFIRFGEFEKSTRIHPWTYSLRNTYAKTKLSEASIEKIWWAIDSVVKNHKDHLIELEPINLVCHYRIGDLAKLTSKHFTSPTHLFSLILKIAKDQPINRCLIVTESMEFVQNHIDKLDNAAVEFKITNLDVLQLIHVGKIAPIFVGTNSKLSVWIAIFRARSEKHANTTFLPAEMREEFLSHYPRSGQFVSYF